MTMQGSYYPQFVGHPLNGGFGPAMQMGEWVGMAMNAGENGGPMDYSNEVAQNKRRRCNTGTGTQASFASLSIDDKLLHMNDKLFRMDSKLENVEQSNKSIETIVQGLSTGLSTTNEQVETVRRRTDYHEQCLKSLAYKSIDLEARSRRNNLLFHGLAESPNEDVYHKLSDFMWTEMCLDIEDFHVERIHRLGSLRRARAMSQTLRRPIIVAFGKYHNTETILETAYMLRGSEFSVSRDLPKEISNARRRLMPQYKQQKQIRGNKVTIEYPAKLVVNGRVIADCFPDWYRYMQMDRWEMLNPVLSENMRNGHDTGTNRDNRDFNVGQFDENITRSDRPSPPPPQPDPPPQPGTQDQPQSPPRTRISPSIESTRVRPLRTYAQVAMSHSQDAAAATTIQHSTSSRNIPRYTSAGNQSSGRQQTGENQYGLTSNAENRDRAWENTTFDQPSYMQL